MAKSIYYSSFPFQLTSASGIFLHINTSAPTAAAAGFANGCIAIHIGGAANANLFINEGTSGSATWVVIPTP